MCLVDRLLTRLRHSRKEPGFILRRISVITCCSLIPKLAEITSNGVRSSHAISMMRDSSRSVKSGNRLARQNVTPDLPIQQYKFVIDGQAGALLSAMNASI